MRDAKAGNLSAWVVLLCALLVVGLWALGRLLS